MRAVLAAGGRGTRIQSLESRLPKPMVPVCGKPILQRQIEFLVAADITEIAVTVGHMREKITGFFGDGAAFGVHLRYFEETEPLGTAGALPFLSDFLTEDFLLINGDLAFDVDLARFAAYHREKGALATLLTHPNSHPYDSALLTKDESGRVLRWYNKEDSHGWLPNRVNAGLHILSPGLLKGLPRGQKLDLDRDLLKPLVPGGGVYAYDTTEYVFDVGTPQRHARVEQDLQSGLVAAKNLSRPQKAVFLDRDGTLNVPRGFISNAAGLALLPGVARAVRLINQSGYLCIVVTNQPVVARGECSFEGLAEIHAKLETLLGEEGAYLDGIYFCPHHPDGGFPGERPELKTDCECRKPKPGLLLQAARDHNIDLARSFMVGDADRDVLAGMAAGCRPVFLGKKALPGALSAVPYCEDLPAFAREYINNGNEDAQPW